jgi:hypothetical protein
LDVNPAPAQSCQAKTHVLAAGGGNQIPARNAAFTINLKIKLIIVVSAIEETLI